MSAESVSEATDEAIEALALRIRDVLIARVHEDGIWRGVVFGGDQGTANTFASLIAVNLASPEGRRALLDVLQPTPEELGGEQVGWVARLFSSEPGYFPFMFSPRVESEHFDDPVWRFPTSERDDR